MKRSTPNKNSQGIAPELLELLPPPPDRFPGRVTLELTNRCNLSCTFCPRKYMEKDRGFMDTGVAKALIDEMGSHAPVTIVPFFRGETLLHPDWFEILSHAQTLNVGEIQFTTNASVMTPDKVNQLLNLELPFISFSLDTVDPALYHASRRGADFQTTLNNVLLFLDRLEQRGCSTKVQVSAVETADHKEGMDDFIAFWQPKVDIVRVYTEHSGDGHPGSLANSILDISHRLPCHKPFTDMVVYWNGEVALCNHDWTRLVSGELIGNAGQLGIEAVWNSPEYEALRRAHKQGELGCITPCDKCDHWKVYYMPSRSIGRAYTNKQSEQV